MQKAQTKVKPVPAGAKAFAWQQVQYISTDGPLAAYTCGLAVAEDLRAFIILARTQDGAGRPQSAFLFELSIFPCV